MESGEKRKGTRAPPESVLEHPLRARMLAELSERGTDPSELAEVLGEPATCLAYHRRVLEAAGYRC